ncbi:hypothetical protein IT414_01905 [bacterium]|nr:hypothetical protein [bacterium]
MASAPAGVDVDDDREVLTDVVAGRDEDDDEDEQRPTGQAHGLGHLVLHAHGVFSFYWGTGLGLRRSL